MICQNCHCQSSNIKYIPGVGERCHNCGGFSEAGGTRSTGLTTRQSFRIRSEQAQFQGDMTPPHVYDKHSKKLVPNPDFVSQFPDRVGDFHSNEELTKAHMPKLAEHSEKIRRTKKTHKAKLKASVEHAGSAAAGVKRVIK